MVQEVLGEARGTAKWFKKYSGKHEAEPSGSRSTRGSTRQNEEKQV